MLRSTNDLTYAMAANFGGGTAADTVQEWADLLGELNPYADGSMLERLAERVAMTDGLDVQDIYASPVWYDLDVLDLIRAVSTEHRLYLTDNVISGAAAGLTVVIKNGFVAEACDAPWTDDDDKDPQGGLQVPAGALVDALPEGVWDVYETEEGLVLLPSALSLD